MYFLKEIYVSNCILKMNNNKNIHHLDFYNYNIFQKGFNFEHDYTICVAKPGGSSETGGMIVRM